MLRATSSLLTYAAERSTVDLDDSDTPTSGMLSRPDRSSFGIKSLKIALKLGNLGQNQVKLNFKVRRSSWGRLMTLRFLIALYRAGWAVIQLQSLGSGMQLLYIQ